MHLPFFLALHIAYPDGLGHVMLKAITPVDDERCTIIQTVLRTDTEADRPAAEIIAFDDVVEQEDAELLNRLPAPFPLAPRLNAHAKADRNSLLLRRLYTELVTGRWLPRLTARRPGQSGHKGPDGSERDGGKRCVTGRQPRLGIVRSVIRLVRNAVLLTMDPDRPDPFPGWFSVSTDGRLTAVEAGEPPASVTEGLAEDQVLDARGALVGPGFVSAHSHLFTSASRGLAMDQSLYGWIEAMTRYTNAAEQDEDVYWLTRHG